MSRSNARWAVVLTLIVILVFAVAGGAIAKKGGVPGTPPDKGGGGGGHTETTPNNLSFPAIAADGSTITAVEEKLTVPYLNPDGSYFTILGEDPESPWYAQKVEGNQWSAEFYTPGTLEVVPVLGVDWGDNIESVKPTIGRPYRLETALYVDRPMTGYTMGMIANPSSPDEIQGTNGTPYTSNYATIYSGEPGLKIQNISSIDTTTLSWSAVNNLWVSSTGAAIPETLITFASELNVGGKYIFGASMGGWKPTAVGTYRLTFYIPLATSTIRMLSDTTLGNLGEDGLWASGTNPEQGAEPILDEYCIANNLTYVDVQVVSKGGGGGKPQ